ncbi:MAG: hypothetical protein ABI400_07735 [Lacisediminihabitans sp.]
MKWFSRQRRVKMRPFNEAELPPVLPISVDDAVSEGLMLAKYSSRMRLKNRIIVGVLTQDRSYDPAQYLGEARRALRLLIDESDLEASRVARQLRIVQSKPGKAAHAHDYRSADAKNLRLREDISEAVMETLRQRASDESYLLDLIESARQDAWDDIARAVEDWLDRATITVDSNYAGERAKRLLLLSEDIAALEAISA